MSKTEGDVLSHTLVERLGAAAFYGCSSIVIMLVNKYLLSVWGFPSSNIVALSQFSCTVCALHCGKMFKWIDFPDVSYETSKEVFPLPLLYLFNTLAGLAGTKVLSIPMFTVLRRLTMLFTLILEYFLLSYTFSREILLSLFIIMFGSFLAASADLSFELYGYIVVFLNNVFTASSGVVSKMKLDKAIETSNNSTGPKGGLGGLGTFGLMFYNSLFSAPILFLFIVLVEPNTIQEARDYPYRNDPIFIFLFLVSSFMGTVLQYSIFYCTKVNSALTVSTVPPSFRLFDLLFRQLLQDVSRMY